VARLARRRRVHRVLLGLGQAVGCLVLLLAVGFVALQVEGTGTPAPAAHGTGHDAEWLGHAWVDGRRGQADVDRLAAQLRGTGIHDLFVHSGPFNNDGTLDSALRPKARWLVDALHAALPGVRVQAWLGAHPVAGQLDLHSSTTRAHILAAATQVLDDGFDGIHYDFEPVVDGDPGLLAILRETHPVTRARGVLLSLSASLIEPAPGIATMASWWVYPLAVWSPGYLHELAGNVDQVALMAYDTWMITQTTYAGYVRRATELALGAVPDHVDLFIGVPAYPDDTNAHHPDVEVMAAALRGVRLALGGRPPRRVIGVSVYVDFTATAADWTVYHSGWADLAG
jgi:hypothetical protein